MARERIYRIVEREVTKNGKTKTFIYAKSSYTDRQGKRHTLWRSGDTRTEAKQRLKDALDKIAQHGDEVVEHAKLTFSDLVKFYKDEYVKPAVYKGDIKVAGLRGAEKVGSLLKPVVSYFGKMKLRNIGHEDIKNYKAKRLAEPYAKGKDKDGNLVMHERALASVNRELSLIRKMLNVAVGKRWIPANPFNHGGGLISEAGEVQRQRTLSKEEEGRIFEACEKDERRAHLKPILMCLMDTGMRRNEVLRLTWADIDFEGGELIAVSFKGKQRVERPVPISRRLGKELRELKKRSRGLPGDLVFGVEGDIKRSWMTVRKLAKLEDVRLHDLRHHAATNYIKSGLSLEETGKILGHRQPSTTWRYVNVNKDTIQRARENLDRLHDED
jgi:integrase